MNEYKIITDETTWNKIVSSFTDRDVYFLYGYFVPFRNYGDGEPNLFYFESENGKVAYPYMLRDIAECKNIEGKMEKGLYYDISTVYGYGGPIYELSKKCNLIDKLKWDFITAFDMYCKNNKIVSQFDRFHPLLKNHVLFEDYSELAQIRKTVKIDLTNEDEIQSNMERRGRQTVRKAKENKISTKIENSATVLKEFYEIYTDTMKKNNAEDYYMFPVSFFESTINNLPDNHMIINAYYEGKIVSTLLNIYSNKFMHSFLGGTDKDYKHLQPSGLLYYESAIWGISKDLKYYHLGGGYTNENDPIYNFKKSFNKNGDNDFYIGKKIHDKALYDQLVQISGNLNSESTYFPKYRS